MELNYHPNKISAKRIFLLQKKNLVVHNLFLYFCPRTFKTRKNMEAIQQADIRDYIMIHLEEDDRSLMWLSKKTGFKYQTLYSIFVQKTINLSLEKKDKINEILGTSF